MADRAEQIARLFHETYERLAPQFGYEPRKETSVPWDEVPEPNKSLMIAVAGEVLERLEGERDRLREALQAIADDDLDASHRARGALSPEQVDPAEPANYCSTCDHYAAPGYVHICTLEQVEPAE